LRREIADLRRTTFTLKSVTLELEKKALRFATHQFSYKDVNERVQKVWEMLEEFKETIEIYKDTDFMLSTERSNKILAVLTIVFTLSIPATVVAAFYGMNINLPGGIETGPWLFLGPYTTLIILIVVSVIPAALMYWIFRRYGWI
jgi:magnesium transporter